MSKPKKAPKKNGIEQLIEDGYEFFPPTLYEAVEIGSELERLEPELDSLDAREDSSGETVVLRWERPMSKADFLMLVEDLQYALSDLRSDLNEVFREAIDIEKSVESAVKGVEA